MAFLHSSLRHACPFGVAGLIVPLLNRCLHSSVFPYCGSVLLFSPVQKSLQNFELTNFRPISVLPILSKLLERIVYNQLVAQFNEFNLLSVCQSGFRPGYSTQDVFL